MPWIKSCGRDIRISVDYLPADPESQWSTIGDERSQGTKKEPFYS